MSLQHPLPSSPQSFAETFRQLCQLVPLSALPELRERIKVAEKKTEILSENYLGPNLALARELSQRSLMLLERYESFNDTQKALSIGAVLYFLAEKDLIDDTKPIVGFDDDVQVMNHVLEQIGFEDDYIKTET